MQRRSVGSSRRPALWGLHMGRWIRLLRSTETRSWEAARNQEVQNRIDCGFDCCWEQDQEKIYVSDPGIEAQKSTGAELTDIVNTYRIDPPLPGVRPLEEPFNGWIMPVAVRATSRHSYNIRVPLDPIMMMRRLDLRTALKLKGAYHVTSPTYLKSILKNGLMPGGWQGKRIMNFFIVFPPWDERNRVTRTRSPLFEEL